MSSIKECGCVYGQKCIRCLLIEDCKQYEMMMGMVRCDDQTDQEAPTLRSADLMPKVLTPAKEFMPMPLTPQNKPTRHDIKLNLNDYQCRCGRRCNSTEVKCWYCTDPIIKKAP